MPKSELSPEFVNLSASQAERHAIALADGKALIKAELIPNLGDGVVVNESEQGRSLNGYLGGALVRRRRRIENGHTHWVHEIGSIANALLQVDRVGDSLQDSINGLAGHFDEQNQWVPGELQQIEERRRELPFWFDLSLPERRFIRDYYGESAESRSVARHPTNIAAWAHAARTEHFTHESMTSDEIDHRAIQLTEQLETELRERYGQLHHQQRINALRRIRFNRWFITESKQLSIADRLLGELMEKPDRAKFRELCETFRRVRFHVQPPNQLAFAVRQTGGYPESAEVLQRTRSGLQFERQYLHLAQPFAVLASKNATVKKLEHTDMDPLLEAMTERQLLLESLRTIGGPYRRLIDKVLLHSEVTVDAIHARKFGAAKKAADTLTWRLERHCVPGDPEFGHDLVEWYGYQL